jgi:Flp pilus assembly protein TadG
MSRFRPGRSRWRRSGAAAAELALALPFLTLLFAVAVDYCRVFYVTQTLQNCAWVGAMYASGTARNPNAASATAAAQQAAVAEGTSLNPPLDAAQVSVSFAGSNAVVTVQYQFQAVTPLMGNGGTVTLTRTTTMTMASTGP